MKHKTKNAFAALLAGALCFSLLSACASTTAPGQTSADPSESGGSETADANNVYDMPSMGLKATLPDALVKRMDDGSVYMLYYENPTEDGSALQYGYLSWMPADVSTADGGNLELDALQNVGVLGVYQSELTGSLDELTGCDEHRELGQSADGVYKYYLSINTSADKTLAGELREIQMTITEMADYAEDTGSVQQPVSSVGSVGNFTTQDVLGNAVTQDIFKEHKLTLVNVFTTWCSPCVAEMPDLEKLYQQMKDQDVGVVGFVLDVLNGKGEIVQEDLERAQELVERTGVTYPVLLPDATYLNGRLTGIEAFPETFFVDENGNIVGETYSGSGSLEDWLEVVEQELAALEGSAS